MRTLTIERWLTLLLALSCILLLGLQLGSLYVAPIHDSYLWWGDESWLMNEYRAQMTSGVFRHPLAFGSSLWIGNPFPFTAMWLTSAIYGLATLSFPSVTIVSIGRTVTAVLAILLVIVLWRKGRSLALPVLSVMVGLALLISCRTFLLTSHSARYDIFTALVLLLIVFHFAERLEAGRATHYARLGILCGSSLMVSVHVPLLLIFPVIYFLVAQRARVNDWLQLVFGASLSAGVLYLLHLVLQPTLTGETNLSENLRTIPILRPFSWSVQTSNLAQKWDSVIVLAPQILGMLIACAMIVRCSAVTRSYKSSVLLLMLPMIGWLLLEPAGPTSYMIHFLPCLALATMMAVQTMLVGIWQRTAIVILALLSIGMGIRDAVVAAEVGRTLTNEHREALLQVEQHTASAHIVAMNPAQSYLTNIAATTHFIELPSRDAARLSGDGYLIGYNSSIDPGFMWEVMPLRSEATSPELMLTGRFLDVGRRYFKPLDQRLDTLFLKKLDLTGLYTRHID